MLVNGLQYVVHNLRNSGAVQSRATSFCLTTAAVEAGTRPMADSSGRAV